jgi:lipopolysaccharide/colanic/teichoic acid biosynthesis glycosyltransferase
MFATAVAREQKRVDRTDRSFGLLSVQIVGTSSPRLLRPIADSVMVATRSTDVVGWLAGGGGVGILVSDLQGFNFAHTVALESRIRRALTTRVGEQILDRVTVRLQVYSSATRIDEPVWMPERPAKVNEVLKRTLDVAASAALLMLLSPVVLLIAAAVKLTSRGPVLFQQERVGQGMKPFTILKFRTMRPDSGHTVHQAYVTGFIKGGGSAAHAAGNLFKLTNDTRVTPIGRILRKTSLDELPQLWNVLRGDMSLVGPRPPIKYEVDEYKGWHRRRVLDAKPGLTGLWQVTGRSRTTFDEMVRLDLRYARTTSIWGDVKILLATPRAVIAGKGAC